MPTLIDYATLFGKILHVAEHVADIETAQAGDLRTGIATILGDLSPTLEYERDGVATVTAYLAQLDDALSNLKTSAVEAALQPILMAALDSLNPSATDVATLIALLVNTMRLEDVKVVDNSGVPTTNLLTYTAQTNKSQPTYGYIPIVYNARLTEFFTDASNVAHPGVPEDGIYAEVVKNPSDTMEMRGYETISIRGNDTKPPGYPEWRQFGPVQQLSVISPVQNNLLVNGGLAELTTALYPGWSMKAGTTWNTDFVLNSTSTYLCPVTYPDDGFSVKAVNTGKEMYQDIDKALLLPGKYIFGGMHYNKGTTAVCTLVMDMNPTNGSSTEKVEVVCPHASDGFSEYPAYGFFNIPGGYTFLEDAARFSIKTSGTYDGSNYCYLDNLFLAPMTLIRNVWWAAMSGYTYPQDYGSYKATAFGTVTESAGVFATFFSRYLDSLLPMTNSGLADSITINDDGSITVAT